MDERRTVRIIKKGIDNELVSAGIYQLPLLRRKNIQSRHCNYGDTLSSSRGHKYQSIHLQDREGVKGAAAAAVQRWIGSSASCLLGL